MYSPIPLQETANCWLPPADAAAKQKYNGLPETLGHEELLQMHWLTLCFQSPGERVCSLRSSALTVGRGQPRLSSGQPRLSLRPLCCPGLEAEYMADVAKQRRPVLMCIFFFDIACYIFRVAVHGVATGGSGLLGKLGTILPQMLNMIALHSIVAWVNWRSRRLGVNAARQVPPLPHETLLCCLTQGQGTASGNRLYWLQGLYAEGGHHFLRNGVGHTCTALIREGGRASI